MTQTIKRIGSYALFGTIIASNSTAPAQASSLKNVTPDDLTIDLYKQASVSNKNILAEAGNLDETNSCISIPEFDLCNQFEDKNDVSSFKNSLLQRAKSSIEIIHASEAVKFEASENEAIVLTENTITSNQPFTNTYTNSKQPEITSKKKVPEPSTMLGLIAFYLLAKKHQRAKKIALQ